MSSTISNNYIYETLVKMFPDAKCELNYHNLFELIVCVVLSAQTTDKNVNKVTPVLFSKYPDAFALANANVEDVKEIIKSIGLANNKSKNIIALSQKLVDNFNGEVPSTLEELESLPGVGHKTASVVLVEGYKIPAMPVDTHIFRVAHRLGLSSGKDVKAVEEDLKNKFDKSTWCHLHILLIDFGRYHCKAIKPSCENCPFASICKKCIIL